MNVDFLSNLQNPRMIVGGAFLAIATALIIGTLYSKQYFLRIKNAFLVSIVFGISFVLALSPWLIKNIFEIYSHPNGLAPQFTEILSGR